MATFTFLLLIIYVISEKKTICNPLAHPTCKCTHTKTCEVPNLFYLTEGLHCSCIFRTCVFHPCEMRCFVLAFSVLAFSTTCVFSAPHLGSRGKGPLNGCCFVVVLTNHRSRTTRRSRCEKDKTTSRYVNGSQRPHRCCRPRIVLSISTTHKLGHGQVLSPQNCAFPLK